MADLDPVVGSEQGGVRPVLIIQSDRGNQSGTTVIVAALTGQPKKPHLPTHVTVSRGTGGLEKDSTVLLEQVRTIEKTRLLRFLGMVPADVMRQVNQALTVSLSTGEP